MTQENKNTAAEAALPPATGSAFERHAIQQLTAILEAAGAPADPQDAIEVMEWADRVRTQEARIEALSRALADAIATFRDDGKETLVTAERQETWRCVLLANGSTPNRPDEGRGRQDERKPQ